MTPKIALRIVQSVLHASSLYTRETSAIVADQIVLFMINNLSDIISAYNTTDEYDLAEQFTRDYLKVIRGS